MKRPKRAIPTRRKTETYYYVVDCPHCRTRLIGGIDLTIDRLFCGHCKEIIMLDWTKLK